MKQELGNFSSLKKNQKVAAALLSIGTFLEYFDLMLYVHMAVLLNKLFFPITDPQTSVLISAFAFCSTFVFRPLGALIFGSIGDRMGRKVAVIIATSIMAISCVVMANLPIYSQIGIIASWLITICRIAQGISSMGELVGAELYLTEITKPPIQYVIVAFVTVASNVGTVFALGIATLVLKLELGWRVVFWIGAFIAIISLIARTSLKETSTFVNAKKNNLSVRVDRKTTTKTIIFLFIMSCSWPICFYFTYVHCGDILQNRFSYTAEAVINHNFIVAMIQLLGTLVYAFLSYKIYPLTIIKIKLLILFLFMPFCPYLLDITTSTFYLFLIQIFIVLFSVATLPATPIFFKHLPVLKRFTYGSMVYALSRTLVYLVTSFGSIYLAKHFGSYMLIIIMAPVGIGSYFGVYHFENLEKQYIAYGGKIKCHTLSTM